MELQPAEVWLLARLVSPTRRPLTEPLDRAALDERLEAVAVEGEVPEL